VLLEELFEKRAERVALEGVLDARLPDCSPDVTGTLDADGRQCL